MSEARPDERVALLRLVDLVIADLSVGLLRHVGRRAEDGDANTFVLQQGEEGRLRLGWPDLGSPASVITMVQAAQRYLTDELGEPVPRCPIHRHTLDLVAVGTGYGWVCHAGRWRCALGDYAEQAWPHFSRELLAPVLCDRLERRGIGGVRSLAVTIEESGPLASFAVADLTTELVSALTEAAAPVEVEVHEHPRQPRRAIEPVVRAERTEPASRVRLVLNGAAVHPGGELGYRVINDGTTPIVTGLGFALNQEDQGWWYSVDTELIFPAVGLGIAPGHERSMSARIPARAVPGNYRLRKSIRLDMPRLRTSQAQPDDLPTELTAEFRVTNP